MQCGATGSLSEEYNNRVLTKVCGQCGGEGTLRQWCGPGPRPAEAPGGGDGGARRAAAGAYDERTAQRLAALEEQRAAHLAEAASMAAMLQQAPGGPQREALGALIRGLEAAAASSAAKLEAARGLGARPGGATGAV